MSLYLVLKLIHVMAVVVFLGNVSFGLFWARRALHSKNLPAVAEAFESIIVSDRLFTIPSVVLIVASGIATAVRGQIPLLETGWVLWPIVLFTMSGLVFAFWVAPLQKRIRAAALAGDEPDLVTTLFRRWETWGLVALTTPFVALIIMVLKPGLPAF